MVSVPVWIQIALMILSSVLSIMVAYLSKKIVKLQDRRDAAEKKMTEEDNALKRGIKAILRDRLIYICTQCEKKGCIAMEDLENISEIYKSYSSLGGNGVAKKIYEDTLKLHLNKVKNDEN